MEEWSFGKKNPIDPKNGDVDAETTLAYNFIQLGSPEKEEEVPAEEVVHCKINTKRSIKRGLTDFYGGTLATLEVAERLRRAVAEGAVEQASISEIIKMTGYSRAQATAFTSAITDRQVEDPVSGAIINTKRSRPATRRVIPDGYDYVEPPGAGNVEPHLAALQACLRAACVRWNAPEFLGSADASNNALASAETSATHFVVTVERARQRTNQRFMRPA